MNDGVVYFSTPKSTVPRIVAATVKTRENKTEKDRAGRSKISGDLRIISKSTSYLKYSEVQDGCLILYEKVATTTEFDFQIPLHNLSINLHSPKNCCQFSLTKYDHITPMATFQVVEAQDYDKWLKVLAVEIIRQTPLNTLKFLDVLFVDQLLKHEIKELQILKPSTTNTAAAETLRRKPEEKKPKLLENAANDDKFCYAFSTRPHRNDRMDFKKPPHSFFPDLSNPFVNRPTKVAYFDKASKSNESYDSGYSSLQSGNGKSDDSPEPSPKMTTPPPFDDTHKSKYFDEIVRRFETDRAKSKIKRSGSFRASVSSSCLNLINKFKKLNNSKDHDGDVSAKRGDGNWPSCAKGKQSCTAPKDVRPSKSQLPWCECPSSVDNHKNDCRKPFTNSNFVEERNLAESTNNFRGNFRPPVRPQARKLSLPNDTARFRGKLPKSRFAVCEYPRESTTRWKEHVETPLEQPLRKSTSRKTSVTFEFPEELLENEETNVLIRLLTKCQIDKQYVPVREKRMLFESLSRLSFSVDNLKKCRPREDIARSSSLGNVSAIPVPVRIMKKYFENLRSE